MALGNGVLCRVPHSAKWPKMIIFNFFYIPSWQINSYKHISHIYLIHHIYILSITYISHPSTHPSAHITSITIYITYILISAQVYPNKSTSPSQVHQSPQVHHKYITKWTTNEKIQRALISGTATVVKAQLHHSEVHEVDYSNHRQMETAQRRKDCMWDMIIWIANLRR